jgi:cytochrome c-type biogenesis protein CcmF
MVIAHLGIAVSLAGMASDASFTVERLVAARVGEPATVGPYQVTLRGISPVIGENWSALQARLDGHAGRRVRMCCYRSSAPSQIRPPQPASRRS